MPIVLVGGGSRSGKTRFALDYARKQGGPLFYIATAQALDDEMKHRVELHRAERGPEWTTIEEPLDLNIPKEGTVVVDCLTLWLSNQMHAGRDVRAQSASLLTPSSTVIYVTSEVGCGIVPDNELARRFRDEAGWLNQRVAESAAEVYWMAFGCPLRVK